MTKNTDNFFKKLSSFSNFAEFTQRSRFTPLPADWYIIITDIQGSTKAINAGLYREVNAASTASIVALLNAIGSLDVPYVFGGDGATMCIPPSQKDVVEPALVAAQQMAASAFNLNLRIGIVPMESVLAAGHTILVGKYQTSSEFHQAMFQGDGLRYAETAVKDPRPDNPYLVPDTIEPNGSFEGFECRWNEVPSAKEETISLIIQVLKEDFDKAERIYAEVAEKIVEIYGQEEQHHPLTTQSMRTTQSPRKLLQEVRIRTQWESLWTKIKYLLWLLLATSIGEYWMRNGMVSETNDWGTYKERVILNTDYRKFDETLRMILAGTAEERQKLSDYLMTRYVSAQKLVVTQI